MRVLYGEGDRYRQGLNLYFNKNCESTPFQNRIM